MRTNFLDWEDKQLVQTALEFEREGIRVTGPTWRVAWPSPRGQPPSPGCASHPSSGRMVRPSRTFCAASSVDQRQSGVCCHLQMCGGRWGRQAAQRSGGMWSRQATQW
ncbi:hypothetical protein GQ600_11248 [Phytophthora cactorum]|nr:hypothetical protein GQ600_11248 [Phytophthora cactorum]